MVELHHLGPTSLLRFCNRHGCPSHAIGMLRLNIPAAGDPERKLPPLQLPVPLLLCRRHADEATPSAFMPREWRDEMRQVLNARGAKVSPDFENAWLDVVPFGETDADASSQTSPYRLGDEARRMTDTESDMLDGYRDGRDPNSPQPSANRSASYRHGFANGRDDLASSPRASAGALRDAAAAAQAEDAGR